MPQASVGDHVEFECSNGEILKIRGDDGATDLDPIGGPVPLRSHTDSTANE